MLFNSTEGGERLVMPVIISFFGEIVGEMIGFQVVPAGGVDLSLTCLVYTSSDGFIGFQSGAGETSLVWGYLSPDPNLLLFVFYEIIFSNY